MSVNSSRLRFHISPEIAAKFREASNALRDMIDAFEPTLKKALGHLFNDNHFQKRKNMFYSIDWTPDYHRRELFKKLLPGNALHVTRKVQQRRAALAKQHVTRPPKNNKRRDKTIVAVKWR